MYFFITCALLLTAAYGAPQNLLTQPNDAEEAYAEATVPSIPYEMPPKYEPNYETNYETTEYQPHEYTTDYKTQYEPKYDTTEDQPQEHNTEDEVVEEPTKPTFIEIIEDKVLELSARPLEKNTDLVIAGKELSKVITGKIVAPALIFNGKVAAAAAALPPLLATKGAIIGTAIATPIEVGALVSSGVITGVTHKLVAVPITLAAGAASKFIDAAERGHQVVEFNLEHGGEILKDGLIKVGQIILKPIAIVVGAQTALTGAGLGIAGTGIKGVGVGVEAVGAKMIATGVGAKVLGQRLIAKHFPPYL